MTLTNKQKAYAIIQELNQRGVPIPDDVRDKLLGKARSKKVRLTDLGYFYRYESKLPYVPNEKVKAFLESKAMYKALIAGRGSGKSCAGAQCSLDKLLVQEQDGAVINPFFENFKLSTWPEFREWIPWDLVIPSQQGRQSPGWVPNGPFDMVFDLGHKKVTAHCKGIRDPESARCPNINWLWYDEAREDPDGFAWQVATAGVRIGNDPQAWITTTPSGQEHWIYRFFVKQDVSQDAINFLKDAGLDRPLVEVFFTTIFDNAENLSPVFIAAMLTMYPEGWLRRQEIYGDFVAGEGAIGAVAAESLKTNQVNVWPDVYYKAIRFWDLAGTEKKIIRGKQVNDPDETVGTLGVLGEDKNTVFFGNQIAGCWSWEDVKKTVSNTALSDGPGVVQVFEQEPASGGKNQIAELRSHLRTELGSEYPLAESLLPRDLGDRVMAANSWFASTSKAEIIMVNDGSWDVDGFIQQVANFPIAKHDDKVTSVSGIWHKLRPTTPTWKKVGFLKL